MTALASNCKFCGENWRFCVGHKVAVLRYNCKFCGQAGEVEYDEACPPLDFHFWQSILCCDRCGKFETKRRRWERVIMRFCGKVYLLQAAVAHTTFSADEFEKYVNKIKPRLDVAAHRLHAVLGEHYLSDSPFDSRLVDTLLLSPDKAWSHLSALRAQHAQSKPSFKATLPYKDEDNE